ncbi:MAG: right-handed parallel beta-helix repeat-containing protein, partial [Leucothrix sp.]
MNNFTIRTLRRMPAFLCLLWGLVAPLQAALTDYTAAQQLAYEAVAAELSSQNDKALTAQDIALNTYWVDAANGIDDASRTGQIDQPWKSIIWAMNNIPFSKNEANVVIREGTYQPAVIYIGKERGGSHSAELPFNILAFPGESVVLDGSNVTTNGAIISIAGAEQVTISGLVFTNIIGRWKSAIYMNDVDNITFASNEISNAKWTTDPDAAESPTLADRLNAVTVAGKSANVVIRDNTLDDLVTGYGEPILVLETAEATLSNNSISNVDAAAFSGQRYYVSPEGDDKEGIGTLDKPWQTIHKALFSIPFNEDDATVIIRGGTYKIPTAMYFGAERGGSEDKYFTVKAYKDEEVVIDGSLLTQPFSSMVSFSSTAYVRIKGLTF